MKKSLVIFIMASLMIAGCAGKAPAPAPAPSEEAADTPTPTPAPTETPTPEPTKEPEVKDAFAVFTEKVAGVWGTDDSMFYEFDGDVLKRGWFESDILPDAHIAEVKELEENKYEVFIKDQSLDDEDAGFTYEGQDFTAVFDGARDDFKETFIISANGGEALFVRMGDDLDEAMKYEFDGGFVDDYKALKAEIMGDKVQGSPLAAGMWYTDEYDETMNWACSYKIELTEDGNATCNGWRNKDSGTYEMTGDNKAVITFDKCEIDSPGEGWVPVKGFVYKIYMTIDGDEAEIKIDAPDVISNLVDGPVHRQ